MDARSPLGEPPGRLFGRTVAVYGLFFGVSVWKKPSDIAPSEAENKWITLAVAANANHPVSRAELTQPAATLITTSIKDIKKNTAAEGRQGPGARLESGSNSPERRHLFTRVKKKSPDSEQASVGPSYIGPLSSRISTPRIRNRAAKHTETHGNTADTHRPTAPHTCPQTAADNRPRAAAGDA